MTVGHQTAYGFGISVSLPYAEAVERTKAALQREGFGVLSEIDVRKTLKEKRDLEFRPYVILGACNPLLAERAFGVDLDIGLLLPCNVVVYETDGGAVIEILDPEKALDLVGNVALRPIAVEAKERLARALATLGG